MTSARFRLCTFDVTNTLLKFRLPVGEQYAKVGLKYGIKRDPDQLTKAFNHHWKLMNLDHPNYGLQTGLTSRMWWKKLLEGVLCQENDEISSDKLDSISDYLYHLYKTDKCWTVASGAKSLLTRLKEQRITLGVISNFDERLDSVLASTGLKPHFNFVLASYTSGTAKPSKDIFDLALRQTADVSPFQALHIGDNVDLDYLAAKDAGWHALLLCNPNKTIDFIDRVSLDDVIEDINDVEKVILS